MEVQKTALYDLHKSLGAKFVPFAGYEMPIQYKDGIVKEHISTRSYAGFFDVSHMGQFFLEGDDTLIEALEKIIPADLKLLIDTNVSGAFFVAQETAKIMINQKYGAIVNMSSIAADIGGGGEFIHYAMSKGAIHSLTYGMAKELGKHGIRVNAVAPGLIDTEIHAKAGDASRVDRLMPSVPLGRVGGAEEVAQTVMWLLSEQSSYISGSIVPVSGGR